MADSILINTFGGGNHSEWDRFEIKHTLEVVID